MPGKNAWGIEDSKRFHVGQATVTYADYYTTIGLSWQQGAFDKVADSP